MLLNSPDILYDGFIPSKYTCDGEDKIPPFVFSYVPADAKSLVFVVEDPDAPAGLWTHLLVWNISPDTTEIKEGEIPKGVVGKNSYMRNEWGSLCPPEGEHRYFFRLYALDTLLELDPETTTRDQLMEEIKEHVLAHAELTGKYAKTEEIPA